MKTYPSSWFAGSRCDLWRSEWQGPVALWDLYVALHELFDSEIVIFGPSARSWLTTPSCEATER